MIIFYGSSNDPPISRAIESAQELQVSYSVLDINHLDQENMLIEIDSDGIKGHIMVADQFVSFDEISGVYARPLDLSRQYGRDQISQLRAKSFQSIFLEWLEFAQTLVVSRPHVMETNFSKPLQAQLIAPCGFAVPDTIVTNSPQEVKEFWQKHQRVIFKSISGIRSIVQELSNDEVDKLDRVQLLPTQFQAYIPGIDVRVHVVGKQVFATEINSNAIDYRYANKAGLKADLTAIELPNEIETQCVNLAASLSLPFCGIDLRRTSNGGYVCFEVNPMPAYTYYQSHTNQDISLSLVKLLADNTY
jgi:glutathione synthase/RimK-type ligase-like ATP-grasp enzyme